MGRLCWKDWARLLAASLLLAGAGTAEAQVLVAVDDAFAVPRGEPLVVEAFGVLDNDILDGENAGENGATAELVSDASDGVLVLAADGSFSYAPGSGFDGSDSFVYRAVSGSVTAEAAVTLSACDGGPQVFTCWKEAAFVALAAALGHPSFQEGFESDAVWGGARSPFSTLQVASRGVVWRANAFDPTHTEPASAPPPPAPRQVTTGPGAARSGQWGIFDPEHGYAWGTEVACDVDDPEPHCLFHDGVSLHRQPGASPLLGAGGYFQGTYGANVAIVIDGDIANPLGGGQIGVGGEHFLGVIDAGPDGWDEIQFRELDGKVGQALLVFADDFTVIAAGAAPVPASSWPGRIVLSLSLGVAAAIGLRRGGRSTGPSVAPRRRHAAGAPGRSPGAGEE